MQLSEHFHLSEFVRSDTAARMGIYNVPPPEATRRLHMLALRVLEPLRRAVGGPIYVSSGYRSLQLNRAIGGAPLSQHTRGEAVDIWSRSVDVVELHSLIQAVVPEWDQLYLHRGKGFVHVSYRVGNNRRQVLPDKET
jgi:zinc D-Ala-D-Ala carboxypeptidase